jgi:hypothetical protein
MAITRYFFRDNEPDFNLDEPCIVMESDDGPRRLVAVLKRVYMPDVLRNLCAALSAPPGEGAGAPE